MAHSRRRTGPGVAYIAHPNAIFFRPVRVLKCARSGCYHHFIFSPQPLLSPPVAAAAAVAAPPRVRQPGTTLPNRARGVTRTVYVIRSAGKRIRVVVDVFYSRRPRGSRRRQIGTFPVELI